MQFLIFGGAEDIREIEVDKPARSCCAFAHHRPGTENFKSLFRGIKPFDDRMPAINLFVIIGIENIVDPVPLDYRLIAGHGNYYPGIDLTGIHYD